MDHSKINHLCRLPDELLDSIFTLAQSSDRSLFLPISKRLLPFLRYYLYHRVRITSYRSLDLFCSTVRISPHLLQIVKSFIVHIKLKSGQTPAREANDVGDPADPILLEVLTKSTEIEDISIYGSTRIVLLVLTSDIMERALPKLSSLSVTSTFRIRDPWSSTYFAKLHQSKLTKLQFTAVRTHGSIRPLGPFDPKWSNPFPLNSVRELSITGPIRYSIEPLLTSFGSLSTLHIVDPDITSDALDVPFPETLTALTVGSSSSFFNSPFYTRVRRLPLQSLSFIASSLVALAALTQLISDPDKHATLQTIVLNNVEGRIGTRIRDVGAPRWSILKKEWTVHSDWILPEWNRHFNEAKLIKFVEVAVGEGIEVRGSALEAISVDAEFEKEWEEIAEYEERIEMERLVKELEGVSLEEK